MLNADLGIEIERMTNTGLWIRSRYSKLEPNNVFSLCLMSCIGVIAQFAIMILPILVGAYVDYLGFGEDKAGWISAANLAGIAVMTLIVSLKARRWPLEKVAGFGLAAMILFDVLTLYFQSLPAFMTLRCLSGMGGGAATAAVLAAIARLAHSDKGYGIYVVVSFLLPAIALYGFPAVLPDIGYNGMLQVLIVLEVTCLLIVPILRNYPLPERSEDADEDSEVFEVGLILQRPAMLSIIGLCLYGAANASVWAYADRIGLNVGLSSEGTGNVLSAITALSVLGAFLVIWLQDRLGHIRPLSIGISLQIAAMLILIGFASPVGFAIGIGLFSISWAFTWPYFLCNQADIDATGTVVVAGQFSNIAGNAMGPAMAAFLVGGGQYVPVLWMTCGLFVASLLPMLAIYRLSPNSNALSTVE